ncbi:MAG: PINc/VapC family ATPase [Halobacteria archaeon]|nr:PINc/VapC family ATPase [Halobacteria archaeon]
MKVIPDTSVIVDGRITQMIEEGEFEGNEVIVPEAVVAELESQANKGRETGHSGLEELKNLKELSQEGRTVMRYEGRRPSFEEIKLAKGGEIDSLIRDLAVEHGATFVTSDYVQSEVARAKGLDVIYLEPEHEEIGDLEIEKYFNDETMSIHLKEGVPPMAKRGTVGEMRFRKIRDTPLSRYQVREMGQEIIEAAERSDNGFTELERDGMTIVQVRDMRIAIARPPFSDGHEITAVRPIADVDLEEYRLSEELKERLIEKQRGIMIAGSPGAGKTTFAQAVAEFLMDHEYSVKTMEAPRDLQVSDEITQYTHLEDSMEKTADALLMVRPDYTIYDEVRKSSDFEVFADMRLAGVGMVGVVHATRAIDSVQRLIGRVELGMIPQVVDTIVHISDGGIEKVYELQSGVKLPAGMTEEDLARPVIEVTDFETGDPEYEIYTYNRQVVVMPVGENADAEPEKGSWKLAEKEIQREVGEVARGYVDVEMKSDEEAVVYVDEDDIPFVIGKQGGTISEIEESLGIGIDVKSHDERPESETAKKPQKVEGNAAEAEMTSRHVILNLEGMEGETVEVSAGDEYLFTATVGRQGDIKVSRGSEIAERLEDAVDRGERIVVNPV